MLKSFYNEVMMYGLVERHPLGAERTREPATNDVMVLLGLSVRLCWEQAQRASSYCKRVLHCPNNKALLSQQHIHGFQKRINRSRNVQL